VVDEIFSRMPERWGSQERTQNSSKQLCPAGVRYGSYKTGGESLMPDDQEHSVAPRKNAIVVGRRRLQDPMLDTEEMKLYSVC